MATEVRFEDTPSILDREITGVRPGRALRYAELTGREKRDYLFAAGIAPTAYAAGQMPDAMQGLLRFSRSALESIAKHLLGQSLTRVSDELEQAKAKLFHTYGTTAKVVFVPAPDSPYSGLFRERAPGLARFSYAGPAHPVFGVGVVPGLGFKFLVDGDHPSANSVVMPSLDRQRSRSVFEKAFTNILPLPKPVNLVMKAVKERFETVAEDGKGLHQPVDPLARVHGDGRPVPDGEVKAPYRLLFAPTPEVRQASDPKLDFRDDLARNVPAGTTIYDVFALDEAEEAALRRERLTTVEQLLARARRIGSIATESEFIASKYGDFRLFFKHSEAFLRQELRSAAA